jgi:hypothetical protein
MDIFGESPWRSHTFSHFLVDTDRRGDLFQSEEDNPDGKGNACAALSVV